MTFIKVKLNEMLSYYEELYDLFKSEPGASTEGKLIVQNNNGSRQFLHLTHCNGKRIRKGINKDTNLIRSLARKELSLEACKILSNNIDVIKDARDRLIPFDPDEILKSMGKAYALLPEEYFFDRNKIRIAHGTDSDAMDRIIERHKEWFEKPYKEYWGYPERKVKTTSRGQKVRSISELLIAEKLYEYSVPFHYEEELQIGRSTFAPDFTFEGWDYNCFYLDYFGMMDNEKYAKKNIRKLDEYYDAGLIPGENLIVVFNGNGIVSAGMIEAIIKNDIIPRL